MFLILALFTVTPNLEGSFRLGHYLTTSSPTSLNLTKDHCVDSYNFLFSHFYIERAYVTACAQVLV